MNSKTGVLKIRIPIPSKKNSMQVRLKPTFWAALVRTGLARRFKHPWWVAPTEKVKEAEQLIAWTAKTRLPDFGSQEVQVKVGVYGRRQDTDNLLGVIADGLEKSGRIQNDRQIARWEVERLGPGVGCVVEVSTWNKPQEAA